MFDHDTTLDSVDHEHGEECLSSDPQYFSVLTVLSVHNMMITGLVTPHTAVSPWSTKNQ